MGLSNELFCEAEHFSHCLNCHRFFQSEVLRLYFPMLEPWVAWSVLLLSCSSWFIHTQMWDHLLCQLPPCRGSSLLWLPVSSSPTSLDEYFFINSLVVGLPYSSIFWQFWLFFCFKICCCPSFGCVGRQSVSIYASILSGSLGEIFSTD